MKFPKDSYTCGTIWGVAQVIGLAQSWPTVVECWHPELGRACYMFASDLTGEARELMRALLAEVSGGEPTEEDLSSHDASDT